MNCKWFQTNQSRNGPPKSGAEALLLQRSGVCRGAARPEWPPLQLGQGVAWLQKVPPAALELHRILGYYRVELSASWALNSGSNMFCSRKICFRGGMSTQFFMKTLQMLYNIVAYTENVRLSYSDCIDIPHFLYGNLTFSVYATVLNICWN